MYRWIKYGLDFIAAFLGFIVLLPLFAVLCLAVKLDSPGPVLFRQKRIGIHKKEFYILKIRTMRIDAPHETATYLLEDPDQYITKVGKFLRKTSLDELPQIINILKGEMSWIGPRPPLWNEYELIEKRERLGVHAVRPGLTGLAQVHGRDELQMDIKVRYDCDYVERLSFLLDVKIFFKTIGLVLKQDGIREGPAITEEKEEAPIAPPEESGVKSLK